MVYNLKKMFGKRSITFLLTLSIVSTIFYSPTVSLIPTQRAYAIFGVGDINIESMPQIVKYILDAIATTMAQQMIDQMVQSTIKWAQSGFEGNPAYVTNPKQYFADIADGVAGEFISGSDLGFLCSPFQTQIRLALLNSYTQPNPFQCTLTGIVGNIDAFYDDFSEGGWDGWFSMTQNPTNNPYGAYLEAKIELDSRIASAVGLKNQQLDWNQGFLSYEKCPDGMVFTGPTNPDNPGGPQPGDCLVDKVTVTPGATIKSQLDKVLPSGLEKLISAQSMDQLVSSFASGLLTRYVFGPKGLFADNSGSDSRGSRGSSGNNSRTGTIDLDNDGIPDGQDSDYDGELESSTDTCFHGGRPSNCVPSSTVTSSPYFTPICQAIDRAVASFTEYTKFLDSHADQMKGGSVLKETIIGSILYGPQIGIVLGIFGLGGGSGVDNFKNKADADIWADRTVAAHSAVEDIISSIRSRNSAYFDNLEIATNRLSNYINKVLESLIKDKDLDLARRGNGGGGLANLMKHSAYNLRYFQEVKKQIGKCENPNISVIDNIPLPPEVEEGGGGGQCTDTGNKYAGDLRSAMDAVLSENPTLANSPNIESGGRQNARTFLALVETKLISMGLNATDEVLNGNSNPSTGDIIAVWRNGDTMMERYDAIIGSAPTIREAATTQFTGFIPLNCTATGGGRSCGCATGGTTPPPEPTPTPTPNPNPGSLYISSVSPTSAIPGVTTLTINGEALTSTVQFFDGTGARNTVVGSVNSAKTQTTVLVPAGLPVGNATVRIYASATSISNGVLISITGTVSGGSPPIQVYAQTNLGDGVFPDVTFFGGKLYVAVKQGNKVNLYRASPELTDMTLYRDFNINADNAFPRLAVSNNVLWLAYRDGQNIQLWRSDTEQIENLGAGYGNDPVALGFSYAAWQNSSNYQIVRRNLTGGTISNVKVGAPTGLDRVLSNGSVVTIDQTMYESTYKVSWGTRPWVAGNLTVAEGATSGDLGRFNNDAGTQFSIFSGIANTPHAATNGAGLYAITTWGSGSVRVAVIRR